MASSPPNKPNHLEPSPLGTKEYWDALYTTEIRNHASDTTDEGTVWFSDSSAEDKVLGFLETKIKEERILGEDVGRDNCAVLDLGTGNGHFLFRLSGLKGDDDGEVRGEDGEGDEEEDKEEDEEEGWGGRMLGVDYSEKSVEFAKRIAGEKYNKHSKRRGGLKTKEVEFKWWDIMTQDPIEHDILFNEQAKGWDVVLDKGTFDAISLSEERDEKGRRICEGYKGRVLPLVREGGIFLVTSCNWTVEELRSWFEDTEGKREGNLRFVEEIKYRSFSFGGRKGQTISSVCFRKEGFR